MIKLSDILHDAFGLHKVFQQVNCAADNHFLRIGFLDEYHCILRKSHLHTSDATLSSSRKPQSNSPAKYSGPMSTATL